jgi:hypothetical protein
MMGSATQASSVRGLDEAHKGHWAGFGVFVVVLAEFGRGVAATRRYEDLRYGRGRHEGIAPADVPRRIFEEFYAPGRGCGFALDGVLKPQSVEPMCAATLIKVREPKS